MSDTRQATGGSEAARAEQLQTARHNVRSLEREWSAIAKQIAELSDQLGSVKDDLVAATDYLESLA